MADNYEDYTKYMSAELVKKEAERRAIQQEAMRKIMADIPTVKYGESPQAAIWRDKAEKLELKCERLTKALEMQKVFWPTIKNP